MEIKAGNVVKLKGSEQHMTVELVYEASFVDINHNQTDIKTDVARVLWFVGHQLNSSVISLEALEKVID